LLRDFVRFNSWKEDFPFWSNAVISPFDNRVFGSQEFQRIDKLRVIGGKNRRSVFRTYDAEFVDLMKPETRAGINGRTATIAAVLLALALGGAATAKPLRTLAPEELQVGTYFINPPFEYMAKGARVGFEVNLMEEIAGRLGLKPIFVNTRWETILEEMQDGRYDCVVGSPSRPRANGYSPGSVPYLTTTLHLALW
jgi:hypothetical protein